MYFRCIKFRQLLPVLVIVVLTGCKKERLDPPESADALFMINCASRNIQGTYYRGIALNNTNTVTLQVYVTKTGSYSVNTATISGIKFSAIGSFTTTGIQTIIIADTGMPASAITT